MKLIIINQIIITIHFHQIDNFIEDAIKLFCLKSKRDISNLIFIFKNQKLNPNMRIGILFRGFERISVFKFEDLHGT